MGSRFRVYAHDDLIGVELGGALKNIIAIGAGAADEFGYGDNAKAAFMTRGLAEIARLGVAAGANPSPSLAWLALGISYVPAPVDIAGITMWGRNWPKGAA